MGLDQYLEVGTLEDRTELIYWRKANQIHAFFNSVIDGGVENCVPHPVRLDDLKRLLFLIEEVLGESVIEGTDDVNIIELSEEGIKEVPYPGKKIVNVEVPESLLPTQDGFFFGSTDYDQWYIEELEHTKQKLIQVIEHHVDGYQYYYFAWW